MEIRNLMSKNVITVGPEESVDVAARMLTHYNIGAVPVCSEAGRLRGIVTDRDMVTRCLAGGRNPSGTKVREVMTPAPVCASPDMQVADALQMMGRNQVRRLPVTENGRLCGMVSLGDLANCTESNAGAGAALTQISSGISVRE